MTKTTHANSGTVKSYSDLLLDPRWQKKRLEILNRDRFRCSLCGDDRTSLSVHHTKYLPDCLPWEYEDQYLITLCQCCHSFVELNKKILGFCIEDIKAIYVRVPKSQMIVRLYRLNETVLVYLFSPEGKIITSYVVSDAVEELCEFLK